MKNLYLVDASNMFYRAFFAIPPLTNEAGMATNALYGFLSMSLKLIREVRPEYLAFCFDRKTSFRNDLYAEYKANRDEMPENLVPQVPYLKKLTTALGIRVIDKEGFEADDVIGTLAQLAVREYVNAVIVSGDKDFAQLVRPGVSLYDTMKDVRTDVDGVKAKFGIRPDQMIDYLAMVGDASDNVPGVRGIGPKGAQKLLHDFENLDAIFDRIDEIKGANQKKLIESRDSAFLSRKLVTIITDVPLDLALDDLKMKVIDREPLRDLLKELGFGSFERKIFNDVGATDGAAPAAKAPPTRAKSGLRKNSGSLAAPGPWTEEQWTLDELRARVKPYSEIWAILNERGLFLGYDAKVVRVAEADVDIGRVLKDKHLRWKGYDVKQALKALGCAQAEVIWDGMLAAYVARAEQIRTFEETYQSHCGKTLPDLCTAADQMTAHQELEIELRQKMIEQDGLAVYDRFDLPLVPVLTDMELKGILIDHDELRGQSEGLATDVKRLEGQIYEAAGDTFNIGSPKQLAEVLFTKLKLPPGRRTKTGFSTDSDVLESLRTVHPVAKFILEYRELSKLKSTYVDALPALARPETRRVHTTLNQAATTTGRLSSTNPNLQNIPIRTDRGRLIRRAFIADPGMVLISADYSQIELRILAHITKDEGLTRAFNDDLDIHAATAAEVFGIAVGAVTANQRRVAKAVNFGIAYGQGAFGLADVLGIPRGEATDIIDRYFKRFAGVKRYMETTIREGIDNGFVSTLFGRRRYIDELQSKNQALRRAGERAAINAPIQGTASDLVKLAMIHAHESLPIALLLQVHDELLFECPAEDAEELGLEIKTIMESVAELSVPLKVNVGVGRNWDDAH